MSENNIPIDYKLPEFPPQSISAVELEILRRLYDNVQGELKKLKGYVYEAEQLHKNAKFINEQWLIDSMLENSIRIRYLEKLLNAPNYYNKRD
jgi:hypothetical protein